MRCSIVYSSKTGNTKKVASAISEVLGVPTYHLTDAPLPSEYDLLYLGFWVDKGTADKQTQAYIASIKGEKIALFGTLGAYPDSDHAIECKQRVEELVSENNQCVGVFLCQGKIDSSLTKAFQGKGSPHPMTPERMARHLESQKHPDENDLKNAQAWAEKLSKKQV